MKNHSAKRGRTVAALAVLTGYGAAVHCAVQKALLRRPAEELLTSEKPYLAWVNDYRAEISDGIAWIEQTPHERWQILSDDGLCLAADFYPTAGARGAVLAFHGYASSAKRDFCCAAKWYAEQGFSVLLVSQRAHGDSGGRYIGMGARERYDCARWAWEADRRLGGMPLVLAGVSMGATTVLCATALSLPASVRAVVADCGFESPMEIFREQAKKRYPVPPSLLLAPADLLVRRRAGFALGEISTVSAMRTNRLPTFFLHGTADRFVPAAHTLAAYRACPAKKRLVLVPGAVHTNAFVVGGERVRAALSEFLADV